MELPPDITRSRVFDGLTDADRRVWLDASSHRLLKRRQALARQGEAAHSFYLVETGLLKLVQVTVDGNELIVRFVGPGGFARGHARRWARCSSDTLMCGPTSCAR